MVDSGLLKEAGALLFVYPRQPSLVKAYLAGWEGEIVVWIGPRADLEEFGPVFDEWAVDKEGEDMRKGAVEAGEGVWVYRRV